MRNILASRGALLLSFFWGLAEATFFCFVPNVALTFLAIRNYRMALDASVAALAGALIGGVLMCVWGLQAANHARAFLIHIPGIHVPLIDAVHGQLQTYGLTGMLVGPPRGTPYKIYAVEWARSKRGSPRFCLSRSRPATLMPSGFRTSP